MYPQYLRTTSSAGGFTQYFDVMYLRTASSAGDLAGSFRGASQQWLGLGSLSRVLQ